MLSKLFLMRKRFVTFAEELLLQNRSVTNVEQVVPHEKDIHYFFLKELLLQNRSVTNAEQVVPHEKEIYYFCRRVIVTEQICYKC